MNKQDIIDSLIELGMTTYEARVFSALTRLGESTVGEIYAEAEVPRSAVYDILEKLEKRRIVECSSGRPKRFKALHPRIAIDRIESKILDASKVAKRKLEEIFQSKHSETTAGTIWVSKGHKNVEEKIEELINSAKKELIIGSHSTMLQSHQKILRTAKRRGVSIKLLTGQDEGVEVLQRLGEVIVFPSDNKMPRIIPDMFAMIVDGSSVLIANLHRSDEHETERLAFLSSDPSFVAFINFTLKELCSKY